MARSVAIKQANGNQARSAMIQFNMDGNATIPTTWDLGVTAVTKDAGGTDVDSSAAIAIQTSGTTANRDAIQALADELASELTGTKAYWTQNSPDQYVVHVQPLAGTTWNVVLSSAVFASGS